MNVIREAVAICLTVVSMISAPIGVLALVMGLSGRLADAGYDDNVVAGVILFSVGIVPLLALVGLIYLWHPKSELRR